MIPNDFIIDSAIAAVDEEYLKGAPLRDLFKEYISGKKQREIAGENCMEIRSALERTVEEIFPYRNSDDPENIFIIEHPDKTVKAFLSHHFLNKWRDGCSYGGAYHLHGLFEWIIHLALLEDTAYYAVIWGEKQADGFAYHLPIDFCCPLAPETISPRRRWWLIGKKIGYKQRLGFLGKILQDKEGYETHKRYFPLQNIWEVKTPLKSPVEICMKYVKKLKSRLQKMSSFTKQQTYPYNLDIRLELARLKRHDVESRNHDLLQAKVERIFQTWPRITNEKITEYYEAFIWLENRLYINLLRKCLIDSLNDQIFKNIKIKSNGDACSIYPNKIELGSSCLLSRTTIGLVGIKTDNEYREIFEKRIKGEMSAEEFQKIQLNDM